MKATSNIWIDKFIDYLMYQKNYSQQTIINYRKDIEDLEAFLIKEELAEGVMHIERERIARHYLSSLDQKGYSKKSIARKISALRSFFRYLQNEGAIEANFFDQLKTPKIEKKLPKSITEDEIELLFNTLDRKHPLGIRNYLIIDLLFSCGLRVSELCDISLANVDTSAKTILIHGKGSKDRYVPIHDKLAEELKSYMTYTRPILLSKGTSIDSKKLLINYKGSELTTRGVRVILKTTIEKAGETFKISPHMLRHSFATSMMNHGADLRTVQDLLGHAHLSSTQIYTHVSKVAIKNAYQNAHPRSIKK